MKLKSCLIKHKALFLIVVCALAIGEGIHRGLKTGSASVIRNQIVDFTLSHYAKLDRGAYDEFVQSVIEGAWIKEDDDYVLSGIMDSEELASMLEDDLGVHGWRLRFVTLEATDHHTLTREEFSSSFRREGEILDFYDPVQAIDRVHIVELTGHVTGRCSIVDWVRPIPVVAVNNRYKMIIRGMPEVYYLLHKEQWFKPIDF